MAKLSVFSRKTTPDNSQEWLAKYDELLRRNRGGGIVQGYDTNSSYRPMVVGGPVADPTGLGQTVSQVANQPTPESPLDLSALSDLLGVDVTNLSPEEIIPIINDLIDQTQGQTEAIDANLNKLAEPKPVPGASPSPLGQAMMSSPSNNNPQTSTPMMSKPAPYPIASLGNGMVRMSDGSVGKEAEVAPILGMTEFDQMINDNNNTLSESERLNSVVPESPKPTYTPKQVVGALGVSEPTSKLITGVTDENVDQFKNPLNYPQIKNGIRDSRTQRVDKYRADQLGLTPDQLAERDNIDIADWKAPEPNNFRQGLGNAVSFIGDKLGVPESGISEFVAGAPTKDFNKAMATDYQISEPDPNMQLQPGAGIDALKGKLQSAQSGGQGIMSKPTMQSIQGMNRSIGEFVGQSAEAISNAKAPNSSIQDNQGQATTINPGVKASISPPMSAPANRSFNQSQSSPSNNFSSSSVRPAPAPTPARPTQMQSKPVMQSVPTQIQSKPAPTPAPTPMQSKPAPAPAPTPAKPQSNIFSSVVNAIANLFRRK